MSQSDQSNSPFGGAGNGTPDPKNPFQIVNEDRPVGGATPSPFGGEVSDSPFGVAAEAGEKSVQLPPTSGSAVPEAPTNPFRSKTPKTDPESSEVEPFGMPEKESGKGGFEMKGINASNAPVNQIGAAPIVGESAGASDAFAGSDAISKSKDEPGSKPRGGGSASAVSQMTPAPVTEIKQLELRAIFGVDHELSRQEMMQRARSLPGVKNLSPISGDEVSALATIKGCMENLGFGTSDSIVLSCPNGEIDFITYGTATMAVVREGDYPPGVRETLIIIARELDKI